MLRGEAHRACEDNLPLLTHLLGALMSAEKKASEEEKEKALGPYR